MKHLNEPTEPLADRFFWYLNSLVIPYNYVKELVEQCGVLDSDIGVESNGFAALFAICALQQEQIIDLKKRVKFLEGT